MSTGERYDRGKYANCYFSVSYFSSSKPGRKKYNKTRKITFQIFPKKSDHYPQQSSFNPLPIVGLDFEVFLWIRPGFQASKPKTSWQKYAQNTRSIARKYVKINMLPRIFAFNIISQIKSIKLMIVYNFSSLFVCKILRKGLLRWVYSLQSENAPAKAKKCVM